MTRSKTVSVLVSVCIFLICVLFPPFVLAEEVIDNDYGYSLDLPEGFSVAEYTQDGFSYIELRRTSIGNINLYTFS